MSAERTWEPGDSRVLSPADEDGYPPNARPLPEFVPADVAALDRRTRQIEAALRSLGETP